MSNYKHRHRKSIRLKGYDYTLAGAYFVTIVTHHREPLLGEIIDCRIVLNDYGQITASTCVWLINHFPYIDLDPYIIMPNHVHAILWIHEMEINSGSGGSRPAASGNIVIKPLGQIIGALKTVSAKQINTIRNTPGVSVWQRNYYEHVIRNHTELENISAYILANPAIWKNDSEYEP